MVLPTTSIRLRTFLCALLVFLVPLLLFLPTVRFGFIDLDDASFVSTNPIIANGLSAVGLRQAFFAPGPAPMYIPILWISYMADITLFGATPDNPAVFHAVNVAFHGINATLLFVLLLRLSSLLTAPAPPKTLPENQKLPPLILPSALLALLWALHPLRVESVAWVTERKDGLSVFFGLLTILAWLPVIKPGLSRRRRLGWGFVSLVLFALGMLSKPSLTPLPVLLAVLALPPMRRRGNLMRLGMALLPFCIVAVLCSLATIVLHNIHNSGVHLPFSARLATVPSVFVFYVSKFLFPRHLALLYPQWTSSAWQGILLLLPLLLVAVWVFLRRGDRPLLWFGTLFAVLFLLPVSGLLSVPFNLVADRYTCLPAIGVSIALLPFFAPPARLRSLLLAVLGLLVAVYALATARHLPSWRNTASVYAPVRRLLPDHYLVRAYDAKEARLHGDFETSVRCIARLLDASPDDTTTTDYTIHLSLASAVAAIDGPETALRFILSHPAPPAHAAAWHVFVTAERLALGQFEETLEDARRALATLPQTVNTRRYVLFAGAIAAWHLSRTEEALQFAHLAKAIPPDSTQFGQADFAPYYTYLWNIGLRREALPFFRNLAVECPRPDILNNFAWMIATAFWSPASPEEAIGLAKTAIALAGPDGPAHPGLLDTLAATYANAANFSAAIEIASRAVDLAKTTNPALASNISARLDLYRHSLPAREIQGRPASPEDYAYSPPADL